MRLLNLLTNLFPVWVLVCGVLALFQPHWFIWFSGNWITWGVAVIMLGMGITLSVDDIRALKTMPRAVGAGFLAQYLFMPFLGWSIAYGLALDGPFAVGLILVSCCPGGTASNVVTYLARANVPLSVLMTMCSTFAAIIMTPLLTKWLAGTLVPVSAGALFLSTVQVVLLPLVIGLALHHYVPRAVKFVLPMAPLISVITIALICASIIGSSARSVINSGGKLVLAVLLLHSGGFLLGYYFARCFGYGQTISRTISIEVGMQNSGLGAALAKAHFANPLTAVPCAISATFHSVIGSILAGIWRLRGPKD